MKIFETECGMKLQWRDWDKLHFEGGKPDKMAICRILNQSRNLTIHKGTTILLSSEALVFVFESFSTAKPK